MRFFYILLVTALSLASSSAATIQFETTFVGVISNQRLFRYSYTDIDAPLQLNQALEVQFDPLLYGTLSNQQAPGNFDVLLIQPNNPPGLPGLYSALALSGAAVPPPLRGFSVDFIFLGAGQPGPQLFQINQFNSQGEFVATLASGVTTTTIPEPGGLTTAGVALLLSGAWRLSRSRRHQ